MRKKKSGMNIEFIIPVAVFFMFTLCALIVILFAARVYQRTIQESSSKYNANTSLAYLREKVHQHNEKNAVRVGKFGDSEALIMTEEIKGISFTTFIYSYNNKLMELFVDSKVESTANPSAGMEILEIKTFHIVKEDDHLLKFFCSDNDGMSATALVEVL